MTDERRADYTLLSEQMSVIHTEVTKVGTRQEDIFMQLKDHKKSIKSLDEDMNKTKGAGLAIAGLGSLGLLGTWFRQYFS
jgi:hypothetical protein